MWRAWTTLHYTCALQARRQRGLQAYLKVDANGNGVTDDGELIRLADAGVRSLNLAHTSQSASAANDAQGNAHQQLGSFTKTDGSTQQMDDVWFAVDATRTVDRELVAVSDAIKALPDLAGSGNLHSLHQAMARDASGQLQALVSHDHLGTWCWGERAPLAAQNDPSFFNLRLSKGK